MSRIYDALKQTENPLVRMIESEQVARPMNPVAESGQLSSILPNTEHISGNSAAPLVDPRNYRIVEVRPDVGVPVLPFDDTDQRTAESYRILRTNILHHPKRPKLIGVSSGGPGDGKTTSAINIAGVLALKQDSRVLLIDGDLRRSSIAASLGIDFAPGLTEVLTGQCALADAIVQISNLENLHVLPAGDASSINPTELLDSAAWRELCQVVGQQFQFTIIDTTPIGHVADYQLIQVACDGVILIVRPDHTNRQAFETAIQQVPKDKLLGTLLNCTEDWFLWQRRDNYGYYGKRS